jgi:hypothetical protein
MKYPDMWDILARADDEPGRMFMCLREKLTKEPGGSASSSGGAGESSGGSTQTQGFSVATAKKLPAGKTNAGATKAVPIDPKNGQPCISLEKEDQPKPYQSGVHYRRYIRNSCAVKYVVMIYYQSSDKQQKVVDGGTSSEFVCIEYKGKSDDCSIIGYTAD